MPTHNRAQPDGAVPEYTPGGAAFEEGTKPNLDVGCPFVKGDAVRHRRGGPVMTVEAIDPPFFFFRFRCTWFDSTGRKSELFRAEDLERVTQE
jgi:uncharacterized protein YodC (DUF2158 family)